MAWEEFAVSGVTESTPTNILLGAGTLYRDFVFDEETKKWNGTILGATSGGNKLSIVPEVLDIEADGVLVKAKGLRHKIGETATIETNMLEITGEWIKSVIIGETGVSADERFDVIESKAIIEDGDYIENFAFVGFKTNGDPIVVIFDYAICTSGLEAEGKNKENSVFPATFECVADLVAGGNTNKLPYHIYTVKDNVTGLEEQKEETADAGYGE